MTDMPLDNAPMPAPREIYARYIGAPSYVAGLGACDLTRQEWDEADPKLTALALELKLYTLDDVPAAPAESAA